MLASIISEAQDVKTDILIIGGSYAGLSALVALKNHLKARKGKQLSVTLIEPKAGLLNILGIPRAIVDIEFAETQFVPLEKLDDIPFDRLLSADLYVQEHLGSTVQPTGRDYLESTYIHGLVVKLGPDSALYVLNGNTEKEARISFSYCVVAAGRNRTWPTSPLAYNFESYMREMRQFNEVTHKCKTIGVVGAGAVGIEIAGDIKHKHPEVDVHLFHPHASFPAEPLTDKFGETIRDSLDRAGVKVHTEVRVRKEHEGVLELSNGEKVPCDFTYWCNGFRNNTGIFGDELARYVSPKNNVYVNAYLQLQLVEETKCVANIFCIGDLVEIPIIKLAGWALYMGRQVANNLVSQIFDNVLVEAFPDLTQMPRGMVLVAGNGEIVSEIMGEVELNNAGYVEEYKDYCIGKIRATLGA